MTAEGHVDEEPVWQREQRLRVEEARMVNIEATLTAIRASSAATQELFQEERKARRAAEEALQRHEADDNAKFASIDTRLMGTQTQLSTIADTLTRIERKVDSSRADADSRLKTLEGVEADRTAVERFLNSAWTHAAGGGAIVGTMAAIYAFVT